MADIQHVVVLMLENRSFDCMLGRLYPNDPGYKGLTLNEMNVCSGTSFGVWNSWGMGPTTVCIPDPDPGEDFTDMNWQLFGVSDRAEATGPATMCGFAQSYANHSQGGASDPAAVMHYFTPDQVPVISTLARSFGVCDQWFASAPCQTWPNRFFAHTGTSLGYVDNRSFPLPFKARSLFGLLNDANKSWRVYFHDMPQSLLLRDVWSSALTHYRFFHQFLADAHAGALPNYSFIEPRYFTDLFKRFIPNDQHPPHNVVYGEQLIAAVYNAVRSSPCWKQTLLIVTYDEHGGCYDHVPPPAATPPDNVVANRDEFNFDFYGVRVPAVIVSPYIPAGSKIQPPTTPGGPNWPFDHTTIIKTVREVFKLGAELTRRDGAAPSLCSALSQTPANLGPPSIDPGVSQPPVVQVAARGVAVPNGMQATLAAAAAALPASAPATAGEIPDSAVPARVSYPTVAIAAAHATAGVSQFLGIESPTGP